MSVSKTKEMLRLLGWVRTKRSEWSMGGGGCTDGERVLRTISGFAEGIVN